MIASHANAVNIRGQVIYVPPEFGSLRPRLVKKFFPKISRDAIQVNYITFFDFMRYDFLVIINIAMHFKNKKLKSKKFGGKVTALVLHRLHKRVRFIHADL